MKKIIVGCNTLTSIGNQAYPSHMNFWFNVGQTLAQEYQFFYYTPQRMSIDRMRNETARMALEIEADYIFFHDDDVILPKDCLNVLLERMKKLDLGVLAGLTYVRSYPYMPMAFCSAGGDKLKFFSSVMDYPGLDGVVYCEAVGFSCCLIDVNKTIKKMEPPYFITGPNNTEDVYFCVKVNNELGKNLVGLCKDVRTGHVLSEMVVNHENVNGFRHLEASLMEEAKNFGDRTNDYIESVEKQLRKES
jgi:hypothetical protein